MQSFASYLISVAELYSESKAAQQGKPSTLFGGVVMIVAGALQCFTPKKFMEIQDSLRPKSDYSSGALGAFFERIREE
jgi:hypothetical protein